MLHLCVHEDGGGLALEPLIVGGFSIYACMRMRGGLVLEPLIVGGFAMFFRRRVLMRMIGCGSNTARGGLFKCSIVAALRGFAFAVFTLK